MRYLSGRSRMPVYRVSGNVVWLIRAAEDRDRRCPDPIASLEQSVMRLSGELRRCKQLQTDITAAVDSRRYELCRRSEMIGARALDRNLAASQSIHLGRLLQFVRSVAAQRCTDCPLEGNPPAQLERLARSIRQLEGTLERSRWLSRDVLAQCRGDRTTPT
ncbi:MAG TPA: hypothetical protein VHE11_10015 [Steroidobacteraceae bacterium]|nr:hypothetical protein [Steroidobacteraceae bacterium]